MIVAYEWTNLFPSLNQNLLKIYIQKDKKK